jgi:hypothetical protein
MRYNFRDVSVDPGPNYCFRFCGVRRALDNRSRLRHSK